MLAGRAQACPELNIYVLSKKIGFSHFYLTLIVKRSQLEKDLVYWYNKPVPDKKKSLLIYLY